jgi:hypothetical protein
MTKTVRRLSNFLSPNLRNVREKRKLQHGACFDETEPEKGEGGRDGREGRLTRLTRLSRRCPGIFPPLADIDSFARLFRSRIVALVARFTSSSPDDIASGLERA